MATWEDAVKLCKAHYSNCYSCPMKGACWEERGDKIKKGRTSDEFKRDMIEASRGVADALDN